jgi:ABC-type microcin C transport system duplicated ATPase subunit YejF
MVFQDPYSSLNPRQRVKDAISEVLRVHFDLSNADRAKRVASLLEQVGLEPSQGDAYPRHLSGGQRQRVTIARALALEPQLLILDEAVAALDVSVQAQVINLLDDLRQQTGVTYLFVSHDLAVVRQVTDETIVLRNGRIVEHGSTEDILTDPQQEYTKALLAAIPKPGWRPRRRGARAVAA